MSQASHIAHARVEAAAPLMAGTERRWRAWSAGRPWLVEDELEEFLDGRVAAVFEGGETLVDFGGAGVETAGQSGVKERALDLGHLCTPAPSLARRRRRGVEPRRKQGLGQLPLGPQRVNH